jgi:predicted AAA+ superfamily ATPase
VTERAYITRLLDARISALSASLPALLITGPRAAGKTTTARRHASTVIHLDRGAEAAAFRADPDAALRSFREPLLLDEWQAVPSVLGAVKRAVDDDPRPGRFLLTGSVRADLLNETWPGTGRLVRLRLYGLTRREFGGRAAGPLFLDRLAQVRRGGVDLFPLPAEVPDLPGYLELAMQSGFPEPLIRLSGSGREAWLEGYLDQILTRDAMELVALRDPARLRRYFEVLALNTAGLPADKTLTEAADINYRTARAYDDLLANLFILDMLPAWSSNNRFSRLIKAPKRHLVDPALVGPALRIDASGLLREGDLMGRVLDTFVAAQLRPEVDVSALRPRLYHLRETHGRQEIDILGDLGRGVIGIEVKATAAPTAPDGRHLRYLQDHLGDAFLGGAVLHTGPRAFVLSDGIVALPICSLWA